MPAPTPRGGKTIRDRHRAAIRRGKPPCYLCGNDIDYTLKSPDPWSFEIDHIIPLTLGGTDDLDNLGPSHRQCNRNKGARAYDPVPRSATPKTPRTFVTSRTWTP